jgi:hypothetical protein
MNKRTTRKQLHATSQAVELMTLGPSVAGRRMSRIAQAGLAPSAADQREFRRMGQEKAEAAMESWWAIASAGMRLNAQLAAMFVSACGRPLSQSPHTLGARATAAAQNSAVEALDNGLAPFGKRARANAKRLRGRK